MTVKEIKQLVADFAEAAKRADRAGFDVIELHGYAHTSGLSRTRFDHPTRRLRV